MTHLHIYIADKVVTEVITDIHLLHLSILLLHLCEHLLNWKMRGKKFMNWSIILPLFNITILILMFFSTWSRYQNFRLLTKFQALHNSYEQTPKSTHRGPILAALLALLRQIRRHNGPLPGQPVTHLKELVVMFLHFHIAHGTCKTATTDGEGQAGQTLSVRRLQKSKHTALWRSIHTWWTLWVYVTTTQNYPKC